MDSRKRLLVVVGFDAANVMRSRGVQRLHEEMKGTAELKQTEKHENNMSINTDTTSACRGQQRAHLMAHGLPVLLVGSFGSRPQRSHVDFGRL